MNEQYILNAFDEQFELSVRKRKQEYEEFRKRISSACKWYSELEVVSGNKSDQWLHRLVYINGVEAACVAYEIRIGFISFTFKPMSRNCDIGAGAGLPRIFYF